MKIPPAYHVRERDVIYIPEKRKFQDANLILSLYFLLKKRNILPDSQQNSMS
jgi:hypothetical protein